jgi:hypothetical protein
VVVDDHGSGLFVREEGAKASGGSWPTHLWVRRSPRYVRVAVCTSVGSRSRSLHGYADRGFYAENELPQPQPPVALGFLKVKPEPCIDET